MSVNETVRALGNPRWPRDSSWLPGKPNDEKEWVRNCGFHGGYTFYNPNLAIFGKNEGNSKEKDCFDSHCGFVY